MDAKEFKRQLLPRYNDMLRMATAILGMRNDAQDVVQEVLAKLWQQADDEINDLPRYCFAMVKRRCIDQLRAARPTVDVDESASVASCDDAMRIEAKSEVDAVRQLMAKLPQGQQQVLRLHAIAQLSDQEISQALGITHQNVRTLLSRARKNIRSMYNKQYGTTQ